MTPPEPLLRWRRTKNGVDLTIGASAGKTLVRVLALLIAAGLLAAGVGTWADVAEPIRLPSQPRIDLNERPPSPRTEPGRFVRGAREPPNRPSTALDARLLRQSARQAGDSFVEGAMRGAGQANTRQAVAGAESVAQVRAP